jgi:hypothetical protein
MYKLNYLKLQQDRYWSDHYYLTREVIRDAVNGSPCLQVDLDALFLNQKDLGYNFEKLTQNRKAGDKLYKELKKHIEIALEIVALAIKGKSIDEAYKRWQYNGRAVACVYHKYHYPIDFKVMNHHMQDHLRTTLAEATAIIGKNCDESQKKGQLALDHVRDMSNYIMSKF